MALRQYTILQTESHATKTTDEEHQRWQQAGATLVVAETPEVVVRRLPEATAIMCATFQVTREVIARAERLRIVARLGTGVDNVDVLAATRKGVAVTNVPDFAKEDVAEHTIALILACAKRLTVLDTAARTGNWQIRSEVQLQTVDGKTLGLVGFGRIGRAVARYAAAMGMRVIAFDPFVDPEDMLLVGQAEPVQTLERLLELSDFVSLHTPLVPTTEHIISRQELQIMKPTAYLINCGRGALVDERALVDAINEGQIAGAGLDVLEQEPPASDSPVLSCPQVIITPHCSAHTERALQKLREEAVGSVLEALRGQWPRNVVNPEVREKWLSQASRR